MPSRPRTPQSSGPGRGTPRTRTGTRRGSSSASVPTATTAADEPARPVPPAADQAAGSVGARVPGRSGGGSGGRGRAQAILARNSLTTRAIALGVVLMVLVLSYASSLRVYVNQRTHIAETQQQITLRQERITGLQAEIGRWSDADFVKAQARQRLGWVVPGETGYKVIGADGKPVGGGVEIQTGTTVPDEPKPAWWARLWGSTTTADHPAPATKPSEPAPITADPTPR